MSSEYIVIFNHGYPLSSDVWDHQMLFLVQQGCRVVAHDRRGFGRSSQLSRGYDHDTFADELVALIVALDLRHMTLVGHPMGVARWHDTSISMEKAERRRWPL